MPRLCTQRAYDKHMKKYPHSELQHDYRYHGMVAKSVAHRAHIEVTNLDKTLARDITLIGFVPHNATVRKGLQKKVSGKDFKRCRICRKKHTSCQTGCCHKYICIPCATKCEWHGMYDVFTCPFCKKIRDSRN